MKFRYVIFFFLICFGLVKYFPSSFFSENRSLKTLSGKDKSSDQESVNTASGEESGSTNFDSYDGDQSIKVAENNLFSRASDDYEESSSSKGFSGKDSEKEGGNSKGDSDGYDSWESNDNSPGSRRRNEWLEYDDDEDDDNDFYSSPRRYRKRDPQTPKNLAEKNVTKDTLNNGDSASNGGIVTSPKPVTPIVPPSNKKGSKGGNQARNNKGKGNNSKGNNNRKGDSRNGKAKAPQKRKIAKNSYIVDEFIPGTNGKSIDWPWIQESVHGPDSDKSKTNVEESVYSAESENTGEENNTLLTLGLKGEVTLKVTKKAWLEDGAGIDFIVYGSGRRVRSDNEKIGTYLCQPAAVGVSETGHVNSYKWFPCNLNDPNGEESFCAGTLPHSDGGNKFDLKKIDIKKIRYIKIRDLDVIGCLDVRDSVVELFSPIKRNGFDLDAVELKHAYTK